MMTGSLAGFITLLVIFGGAAIYTMVVLRWSRQQQKPEQPSKTYYRAIADQHAEQLKQRGKAHFDGMLTIQEWLDIAARRLMDFWKLDLDSAVKEMREALAFYEMRFGDPAYDWSANTAREFAEDYAREYGEQYGSNT